MSVRKRIFISMVALTIVCGIAVLAASITLFTIEINDAMYERNTIAENVLRHELDRMKTQANIVAFGMANTEDLRDALKNNDRDRIVAIANSLKVMGQIDYCTIMDGTGTVITRTHAPDDYGDNIGHLPHIRSAMYGKTEVHFIQGPVVRLGIAAGTPIFDDDMNIIGLVSMGFRLDEQEIVYNLQAITGCEIMFFQNDVSVASTFRNDDGSYLIGFVTTPHITEHVFAGEVYTGRKQFLDRNILVRYIPLHGVNDEIVGMAFIGSYTEEETGKIFFFIIIGVLVTLLVLLICLIIARILSKTIDDILNDMMTKLRDASNAKGAFLATMSHEMRTPLNAIVGMTMVGKRAVTSEEKTRSLDKIEQASEHLLGVVNDILDMAKIEANKLELAYVEFNFEEMLSKVLTIMTFRAEDKKQTLSLHIDDAIPKFVIGDDQRLAQAITNLLSNAIKFTPKKGEISLNIFLEDETSDKCELRFEVVDNGIGIAHEQQVKLFGAFEQAESGISREYGGTGLGLAITKRIVELMGGRIWVESELGVGSNFAFTVFLKRDLAKEMNLSEYTLEQIIEKDDDYGDGILHRFDEYLGYTMLLAEDIEVNREIVLTLLEETGIQIDCVATGKEALDVISENPGNYDIVFMDLQMPEMGGIEATKLIRELPDEWCKNLPIIAMTANVFKEDIDACHDAGMNGHLGKPLDFGKVFKILDKYLFNTKNPDNPLEN